MWTPKDSVLDPLNVVTVVYNPVRFKSRWKLAWDMFKHMQDSGAVLWVIEAKFRNRQPALRDLGEILGDRYIVVETEDEIWLKENLLNLAIERIPKQEELFAWIDADVRFVRPDWVSETKHRLQHAPFVQLWSQAVDLKPNYEILQTHNSFAYCFLNGVPHPPKGDYYYSPPSPTPGGSHLWHPGFAWAARRREFDEVGRLLDWAILGAADNHMAKALIGRVEDTLHPKLHPNYKARALLWQERAKKWVNGNIDYVPGLLLHYWHGKKVDRRYKDRWQILIDHQYDPALDIKAGSQGVYQLTSNKPELRDALRRYFRQRNEDSIDI
jgi:hypothetical protein